VPDRWSLGQRHLDPWLELRALKVLFVCSRNRLRSLTAETIFDGRNGHHVRSVGTEEGARIRATPGHIHTSTSAMPQVDSCGSGLRGISSQSHSPRREDCALAILKVP